MTDGLLRVQFKGTAVHDSVLLQLYSMDGALQLSQKVAVVPDQYIQWQIGQLPPGTYTLKTTVEGRITSKKVVIAGEKY